MADLVNGAKAGFMPGGNAPKVGGGFSMSPKQQMLLSAAQGILEANRGQLVDIGNGFMMRDRTGAGGKVLNRVGSTMGRLNEQSREDALREAENEEFMRRLDKRFELQGIENERNRDFRRGLQQDSQGFDKDMFQMRLGANREDYQTRREDSLEDFEMRLGAKREDYQTRREDELEDASRMNANRLRDQYGDLLMDAASVGAPRTKTRTSNRLKDDGTIQRRNSEAPMNVNELKESIGEAEYSNARQARQQVTSQDIADREANAIEAEFAAEFGDRAMGVGDVAFNMLLNGASPAEVRAQVRRKLSTASTVPRPGGAMTGDDFVRGALGGQ